MSRDFKTTAQPHREERWLLSPWHPLLIAELGSERLNIVLLKVQETVLMGWSRPVGKPSLPFLQVDGGSGAWGPDVGATSIFQRPTVKVTVAGGPVGELFGVRRGRRGNMHGPARYEEGRYKGAHMSLM